MIIGVYLTSNFVLADYQVKRGRAERDFHPTAQLKLFNNQNQSG